MSEETAGGDRRQRRRDADRRQEEPSTERAERSDRRELGGPRTAAGVSPPSANATA
jgi:hypothetical protein